MSIIGLRKLNPDMLSHSKYDWTDVVWFLVAIVLYIAMVKAFIAAM